MAVVFTSRHQDEALVVKSLLESAGMEAEITGEHPLDVNPVFYAEEKGVSVFVEDDQEEDARKIVEDFLANEAKGLPADPKAVEP